MHEDTKYTHVLSELAMHRSRHNIGDLQVTNIRGMVSFRGELGLVVQGLSDIAVRSYINR